MHTIPTPLPNHALPSPVGQKVRRPSCPPRPLTYAPPTPTTLAATRSPCPSSEASSPSSVYSFRGTRENLRFPSTPPPLLPPNSSRQLRVCHPLLLVNFSSVRFVLVSEQASASVASVGRQFFSHALERWKIEKKIQDQDSCLFQ